MGKRLKQFTLPVLAIALVVGAIAWSSVLMTDKGVDCGTAWKAAHGVMVPELNAGIHVSAGTDGIDLNNTNSHFVTYCVGQGRLRLAESGVMVAGAVAIVVVPFVSRRRRHGPDVPVA